MTPHPRRADLVGFDTWKDVLDFARAGGWLFYQAPLDYYVSSIRVVKIYKNGKIRIDPMTRDADNFTADRGHLDRFYRKRDDVRGMYQGDYRRSRRDWPGARRGHARAAKKRLGAAATVAYVKSMGYDPHKMTGNTWPSAVLRRLTRSDRMFVSMLGLDQGYEDDSYGYEGGAEEENERKIKAALSSGKITRAEADDLVSRWVHGF